GLLERGNRMRSSKRLHPSVSMFTSTIVALVGGRAHAGFVFTNFNAPPPDAGGVQISGITNDATVLGVVFDADFNVQGFLRSAAGVLTPFALPNGSAAGPFQTQLGGINDNHVVVGYLPTFPGAHGNPLLVFQNGVVTEQIILPPEFGNST